MTMARGKRTKRGGGGGLRRPPPPPAESEEPPPSRNDGGCDSSTIATRGGDDGGGRSNSNSKSKRRNPQDPPDESPLTMMMPSREEDAVTVSINSHSRGGSNDGRRGGSGNGNGRKSTQGRRPLSPPPDLSASESRHSSTRRQLEQSILPPKQQRKRQLPPSSNKTPAARSMYDDRYSGTSTIIPRNTNDDDSLLLHSEEEQYQQYQEQLYHQQYTAQQDQSQQSQSRTHPQHSQFIAQQESSHHQAYQQHLPKQQVVSSTHRQFNLSPLCNVEMTSSLSHKEKARQRDIIQKQKKMDRNNDGSSNRRQTKKHARVVVDEEAPSFHQGRYYSRQGEEEETQSNKKQQSKTPRGNENKRRNTKKGHNPLEFNGQVLAYLDSSESDHDKTENHNDVMGDDSSEDDSEEYVKEKRGKRQHELFYTSLYHNENDVEDEEGQSRIGELPKRHEEFYNCGRDDDSNDDDAYDYSNDDDDEERPLRTKTKKRGPPSSSTTVLSRSEQCLNRTLLLSFFFISFIMIRNKTPWWKSHERKRIALQNQHNTNGNANMGYIDPMAVYNSNDDDSTMTRDHDPTGRYDEFTKHHHVGSNGGTGDVDQFIKDRTKANGIRNGDAATKGGASNAADVEQFLKDHTTKGNENGGGGVTTAEDASKWATKDEEGTILVHKQDDKSNNKYFEVAAGERISKRPGQKSLHHGFMDETYKDRPPDEHYNGGSTALLDSEEKAQYLEHTLSGGPGMDDTNNNGGGPPPPNSGGPGGAIVSVASPQQQQQMMVTTEAGTTNAQEEVSGSSTLSTPHQHLEETTPYQQEEKYSPPIPKHQDLEGQMPLNPALEARYAPPPTPSSNTEHYEELSGNANMPNTPAITPEGYHQEFSSSSSLPAVPEHYKGEDLVVDDPQNHDLEYLDAQNDAANNAQRDDLEDTNADQEWHQEWDGTDDGVDSTSTQQQSLSGDKNEAASSALVTSSDDHLPMEMPWGGDNSVDIIAQKMSDAANDNNPPQKNAAQSLQEMAADGVEEVGNNDSVIDASLADRIQESEQLLKELHLGGAESEDDSANDQNMDSKSVEQSAPPPNHEDASAKSPVSSSESPPSSSISSSTPLDQPIFNQGPISPAEIKTVYENSYYRWNHPLRPIRQGDFGKDVPVFWRIPRSASGTVESVLSFCYRMVLANSMGTVQGHGDDEVLDIISLGTGAQYVNVDMSNPTGIQRAKSMNLGSSSMADIIATPFLFETASIFNDINDVSGKCFTLLRHPVDRAISMYHHYQIDESGNPNTVQYKGMNIDDFAENVAENNWMVRFLANKRGGSLTWQDLESAKEVFGKKCLVGLLSKTEESLSRYERFFGWDRKMSSNSDAKNKCVRQYLDNGDKRKEHPTYEGTAAWEVLRKKNEYDVLLYQFAEQLYTQQSTIYEKMT